MFASIYFFLQTHGIYIYLFLFFKGKLPSDGWNDLSIRQVLNEIALMDSNNFPSKPWNIT